VDAGNWITLAAVIVAIIATVPAYVSLAFARKAADSAVGQTKLQRQIAHEARLPMLWADIRPHPEARAVMCLFLGNSGPTTAHDVRAVIEPRILPGAVARSSVTPTAVAALAGSGSQCEVGRPSRATRRRRVPHTGRCATAPSSLGAGTDPRRLSA
jgi:hypothetical protein